MQPTIFTIPGLNLPIKGYGLMLMIGFLTAIYWATRRAMKVKGDPDLILNAGFLALIFGVAGARVMFVIHHWEDSFAERKNIFWAVLDVTAGGLEFLGGLLGALTVILLYLLWRGVSLRMYFDIIAPSVMWGLAVTRVGCFLNGCCWGGQCDLSWGVQFPYGSPAHQQQWLDREVALPAELLIDYRNGRWGPLSADIINQAVRLDVDAATATSSPAKPTVASRQRDRLRALLGAPMRWYGVSALKLQELAGLDEHRSEKVHPAQIYAAINAALLALLLAALFRVRKRHGVVFGVMLTLYPISRIALEAVRVDNALDTAGLTISQAISVAMLGSALLYWLWLYRQPLRSPRAVPFVPPPPQEKKKRKR